VEDYLTWELRIETLWRFHAYTKDKKVRLASSEFDGMHCVGGIIL
jgi:hypothetical protein